MVALVARPFECVKFEFEIEFDSWKELASSCDLISVSFGENSLTRCRWKMEGRFTGFQGSAHKSCIRPVDMSFLARRDI